MSGYELFEKALALLFPSESVPDSGIVMSTDGSVADGGRIEKSCYQKGGLRFLYRSYAETDLGEFGFPITQLSAALTGLVKLYITEVVGGVVNRLSLDACWAVCQREGDYAALHNHISPQDNGARRYSGMFYLRTPATINPKTFPDGCLHIVTPAEVLYYPPIPGSIVIWPAELVHGVHPFRGSGDRLGIAFDVVNM